MRIMKKWIWPLIGVIIIGIIVGIFVSQKRTKQPEVIKIGAILPLTGPAGKYGQWVKEGMELALSEVNSYTKKYSFKLIIEDDKGIPKEAVNAVNKLIKVDKVPVITGAVLSKVVLSVSPIVEKNKIVLLSVGASAVKIRKAGDYVFRIRETAREHGKKAADFALTISRRAGVIFLNAENGVSYAEQFKKYYEENGGKIVLWEKYNEGETDFRSYLLKVKQLNLAVVYIPGLVPEIAFILKQAKELGVKAIFISSVGAQNPKLIEIARDAAEGLIYTYPYFDTRLAKTDKKVKEFVKKYYESYKHYPEFLAANGYDAIKLLASIISKYGYTPENIKNALYKVKNFHGVGGTFTFDEYGDVFKPVILKQIKNGKFTVFEIATYGR